MCEDNTIYGTKFHCCPNSNGKILVNDISSSFLSEPMNASNYGMLFGRRAEKSGICRTGSTYNIYMVGKVLKWIQAVVK